MICACRIVGSRGERCASCQQGFHKTCKWGKAKAAILAVFTEVSSRRPSLFTDSSRLHGILTHSQRVPAAPFQANPRSDAILVRPSPVRSVMPDQELKNLDDYEIFLTERMTPWSARQRVALAAAIAERWLPVYEAFSAEEDWGDPATLRRSLEAIWAHVEGRTPLDIARHIKQIDDITPHMDDFDAMDALTASATLADAVRACGS